MPEQQQTGVRDIPHLLHDATLRLIQFDERLCIARIDFRCLLADSARRAAAGGIVELRLLSVDRVAAYYEAADFRERLTDVLPADRIEFSALGCLHFDDLECDIWVDSLNALFDLRTSVRVDWLFGDPLGEDAEAVPHTVFIKLDVSQDKPGVVRQALFFQCERIEAWSAGIPLPLDDWAAQYAAWWEKWRKHWESKGDDDENEEPVEEDTFIPLAESTPPDTRIRPPDKPAFDLIVPRGLEDLLTPVRDFHEAILARDWHRLAHAWPDLDKDENEQAMDLEAMFLGDRFGRWVYLRQLEESWQDDVRACVRLRGAEFVAPFEGDPATVDETVLSYSLKRLGDRWVVRAFSQGWPGYGSAPESTEPTPWLDEWREIVSRWES